MNKLINQTKTINNRRAFLYQEDDNTHYLNFEISKDDNDDELQSEFTGSIKYGGCCNFQSNKDMMLHICDVSEMYDIADLMQQIYLMAYDYFTTGKSINFDIKKTNR